MAEERRASSTFEHLWSTVEHWAEEFPALSDSRLHRKGMSRKVEKRFHVASSLLIGLIAAGWMWTIATGRTDASGMSRTGAIISRALTDSRAPSTAYLTDLALGLVTPARGESGRLRARVEDPGAPLSSDTLPAGTVATFSAGHAAESTAVLAAPKRSGVWSLALAVGNAIRPVADFSLITLKPASEKRGGRIGLYFIGNWPSERTAGGVRYQPPKGFIEVTREQQNTLLSDHFRLKDFFPHDQANVWPKYIVVEMKLVDKLELILAELEKQGIPSAGVKVMSGFRTPQYNAGVGDTRGRASLSRHMYGDAADIFIDNDGNGNMDDLNKDGKVNTSDARVILAAANRVEAAHPSLIGGVGVYPGTSAHGPFTHIDTRGYPARW